MKVIWTNSALSSFAEIIDFLEITWGQKYIQEFYNLSEEVIAQIKENPYQFKPSPKHPEIRKGFVHKHISLFYKVNPDDNHIYLLYFQDNRSNPK